MEGGGERGEGGLRERWRRGGIQLPGIYTVNSIQTLNCAFLRQDTSLLPLILQPPTLYSSLTAPPTSPVLFTPHTGIPQCGWTEWPDPSQPPRPLLHPRPAVLHRLRTGTDMANENTVMILLATLVD